MLHRDPRKNSMLFRDERVSSPARARAGKRVPGRGLSGTETGLTAERTLNRGFAQSADNRLSCILKYA
jgi:hypothetical protein